MAAVASSSRLALDAAPPSTPQAATPQPPPRLLLRLPPEPESDASRHPLKRKWRSFVNFFALPIRSYYLEPPGVAYRNQLRAQRASAWDGHDDHAAYWPCPAYTDQVGDDEMVLFKAQEEAEALAAMQRAAQEPEPVSSPELNDGLTDDDDDDGDDDQAVEQLRSPRMVPQTPPEAFAMSVTPAEPSPRYESTDPLSTFPLASIPTPQRPRLAPSTTDAPTFLSGITIARQRSTPLTPTALSSSPPSSILPRRSRAQTNATAAARPTLAARHISEPLGWTLVRSQYSYPKRGLTAEQLTFLSSVESLGRFGVPHSPEAVATPAYEVSSSGGGGVDYGFPSMGEAQRAHR
ncbi:uncharacterized protein SRS1_10756 [Sporisorium reilianum f. sp. reilianum]|uniref:Uncharacterized protein n=1 Tax=Sporisorium reilianum f. sp. reilianum TaxID=72559 RepID=A0A2N8UC31_9BASI|nr:uncharacterized protein SRS1_10756 [Sporisorium reilianum f. sp. reilianum]